MKNVIGNSPVAKGLTVGLTAAFFSLAISSASAALMNSADVHDAEMQAAVPLGKWAKLDDVITAASDKANKVESAWIYHGIYRLGESNGAEYSLDKQIREKPSRVPEPASILLMGLGLLSLGIARRRVSK